jgi:hypothetical protein
VAWFLVQIPRMRTERIVVLPFIRKVVSGIGVMLCVHRIIFLVLFEPSTLSRQGLTWTWSELFAIR